MRYYSCQEGEALRGLKEDAMSRRYYHLVINSIIDELSRAWDIAIDLYVKVPTNENKANMEYWRDAYFKVHDMYYPEG